MRIALVLVASMVAACAADSVSTEELAATKDKTKKCQPHKYKDKWHGDCLTATATIGVSGGQIATLDGVTLDVPFGALDGATTVTVNTTDVVPPPEIAAVSPVYEFLPEGIVFATPVKVTLPLPAGVTSGSVYWSRLDGSGFDELGGTISNGTRPLTSAWRSSVRRAALVSSTEPRRTRGSRRRRGRRFRRSSRLERSKQSSTMGMETTWPSRARTMRPERSRSPQIRTMQRCRRYRTAGTSCMRTRRKAICVTSWS